MKESYCYLYLTYDDKTHYKAQQNPRMDPTLEIIFIGICNKNLVELPL